MIRKLKLKISPPMLPEDPEPTENQLKEYISRCVLVRPDQKARLRIAKFLWRMDELRNNPDVFLVAFKEGIRSFSDHSKDYDDYLQGDLWKSIRSSILDRSSGRCECCGGTANQVHHKDYRPRVIRGDDFRPLVAVCKRCHEYIHIDPKTRVFREYYDEHESALAKTYKVGF